MEQKTETKQIKDLLVGESIVFYALVETAKEGKDKNQAPFVDFTLKDKTGKIEAKLWETPISALGSIEGSIVKVSGTVKLYQEKPQITIDKNKKLGTPLIRSINETDEVNTAEIIPISPISPEQMYNELVDIVEEFALADMKKLCSKFLTTYKDDLLLYPGAQKVHHVYLGGLLHHIYCMVKAGTNYATIYNLNKDLLLGGCILHDMGKIPCMTATAVGTIKEFTMAGEMNGHMVEGVKMLNSLASKLKIDQVIMAIVENMIISHHYEEVWGAYQKPATKEALMLHFLDLADSKMNIAEESLSNAPTNKFAEKEYFLGNSKLFNHGL